MSSENEIESRVNIEELLTDRKQQEYLAKLSKAEEVWNGHNLMTETREISNSSLVMRGRQSLPNPLSLALQRCGCRFEKDFICSYIE